MVGFLMFRYSLNSLIVFLVRAYKLENKIKNILVKILGPHPDVHAPHPNTTIITAARFLTGIFSFPVSCAKSRFFKMLLIFISVPNLLP